MKLITILLLFILVQCLHKIKFSALEKVQGGLGNKYVNIDCRVSKDHTELERNLCFGNLSRPKNNSTDESDMGTFSKNSSLNPITEKPSTDKILYLLRENITIILEDILLKSPPFSPTNLHPYRYISLPKECRFYGERQSILVLVHSSPESTTRRRFIRKSWTELKDSNIQLVFLLGQDEDVQYMVEDESDRYRDILQENYPDSAKHSRYKMIMGYNWAVEHCPTADVILSLMDTIQLKSEMVFEYIRDILDRSPTNLYSGKLVTRGNTSYISSDVSVVSKDVAVQFRTIFPFVKIQEEDTMAYLGLVAKILDIPPSHDPYFDSDYPLSYFTTVGKNGSNDLLSYPLSINLRRLVRRKIGYNETIPHSPVNEKLNPLIHNATRCNFVNNSIENVLVVTISAAEDREQRLALRDLWKSRDILNLRQLFVIGSEENVNQTFIDDESATYGDVIQIDTDNGWLFNTLQTVATYKWIVKNCKKANIVIFLDGNIYVNLTQIGRYIKKLANEMNSNYFAGYFVDTGKPIREKSSPSYISEEDFPFDQYPSYIYATNYVMSFKVLKLFHTAFPYIKYGPIVDIYLGVVASKLLVKPKHDHHFDKMHPQSFLRDMP